jgi:hypothetical protein
MKSSRGAGFGTIGSGRGRGRGGSDSQMGMGWSGGRVSGGAGISGNRGGTGGRGGGKREFDEENIDENSSEDSMRLESDSSPKSSRPPSRPSSSTKTLPKNISSISLNLDGEHLEMDQVIEFLNKKLETIFQEMSSHQFQAAEDSLEISNLTKSSFSISENLTSPLLLLILCEKYYQEFQFNSSSSCTISSSPSFTRQASPRHSSNYHNKTATLVNSYLQIISDIDLLFRIFSSNQNCPPTNGSGTNPASRQMRFHESTSLCSSLTSNFSYISLDSVTEDFYQIQEEDLQNTPVPSPTARGSPAPTTAASAAPGVNAEPNADSDAPVVIDPSPLISEDHRHLLQLLQDLNLFLTIRQSLINLHLTFNLYSPLYTLESHLKCFHLILTAATHPSTQAAEPLFQTLRLEVTCLINIFDCRFHILKGKYVGLMLSCDQLRDNLLAWAQLTRQQLPIRLKSPEEMGYGSADLDYGPAGSSSNELPSRDWDCLLGWMCGCYRRFLAVSQLLFQNKRKRVHELLTESEVPPLLPSSQDVMITTPTLSPRASFISRLRSPTFSISSHACSLCQSYQHCICPNSDHRCLNHDMTSLVAAIDQFFIHGKVHFKELSLAFVCLTSDGELATAQYLCPPRDQWELINHPPQSHSVDQTIPRSRIGSAESIASLSGNMSRRNSQDNISGSSGGGGGIGYNLASYALSSSSLLSTELVLLSKLSPSAAVTGIIPSSSSSSQRRGMTRDRSTSNTNEIEHVSSLEEERTIAATSGGLGRRNSLSQNKIQSSNSINELSSMPQPALRHAGRANSLLRPQPLVPGFSYSHNPLNIHFTSHHIDTSEELEILRRQEAAATAAAAAAEITDYDSKWMETHLHRIKTIIEYHLTNRLQSNPMARSMMRNNGTGNLNGPATQLNAAISTSPLSDCVGMGSGGGLAVGGVVGEIEKKKSPICVPIFDSTHTSQSHSRGYSIIAPLPGSALIQPTGSFISVGESSAVGGGGTGAAGAGGGGGATKGGGDQSDLGMGIRNSLNNNQSSQIFLVGVLLDRRGGEPEMKHEMITSQHVDDVGREMSRVVKNITELVSGKDLFKAM